MVDKGVLIDLVRERIVLWDQRKKLYHNRDLRAKLWEEVGKIMKIEGNEARKQWELLRDMFRKKMKETKGVSGASAKPKWTYFEALSFLTPMIKPRATSRNLPILDTSNSEEHVEASVHWMSQDQTENDLGPSTKLEEDLGEEFTQEESPQQITNTNTDPQRPAKRKQASSIHKEALELERRQVQLMERRFATGPENEDDDLSFFKSLLPFMKKLSDIRKIKLRSTILNCVIAELEAEESSTWPSRTGSIQPPSCPSSHVCNYGAHTPSPNLLARPLRKIHQSH